MFHTLRHVRIVGIRSAVPTTEIRLEDELTFYGDNAKKVARLRAALGMDRRRVCPPDVTASDLCAHAADALLKAIPDMRSTIDALVFVSRASDWPQPARACELQQRLGLVQQCVACNINQGCSGYIYGLWISSSLIASGAARQVLLLVGDVNPAGRDTRNRITTPIFGDGGSATLLVRDEHASPIHFGLGTDGSNFETVITPAGGARIPFLGGDPADNAGLVRDITDPFGNLWHLSDMYMDGEAIFNFALDIVPEHIHEALAYAGLTEKDVAWLILHQANKLIVESIAAKAGIALEKTPSASFSKYGNLASASIPTALCDAFGTTRHPPGKVLLCGYDASSWGSCLCDIATWDCAPPLDYEADPNLPTRNAHGK